MKRIVIAVTLVVGLAWPTHATQSDRYAGLDRLLDTYIRDGLAYYNALHAEAATVERVVRSFDVPAAEVEAWPAAEQEAFWINAYNAIVLHIVASHYPIRGTSASYPRNSIRQVPGAFDRLTWRVAGATLTLDAIESRLIDRFGDARIVLALGRGAIGSGRLRSEAFRADRLDRQLEEAVEECAARTVCSSINRAAGTITVTPLVGWRSDVFEKFFTPAAGGRWRSRSPIERAVAAMLAPVVFPSERTFLEEDTFRLEYGSFDWSLNEL